MNQIKIAWELLKGDFRKEEKQKRHQLYTTWGKNLNEEQVLKEYPRPSLMRESYLNLNGYWDYAITREAQVPITYEGRILVPFSPEAVLSGVERQVYPGDFLHYKKVIVLPEGFLKERLLLHFGAVDQCCSVYVNGKKAGNHEGGYLPFTLDITELSEERMIVQVVVRDDSDTSWHSVGKQKLKRGGMFYQAQSGIWQSVWMESVPKTYIQKVKFTPIYDRGEIACKVFAEGLETADISIYADDKCVVKTKLLLNQNVRIKLPEVKSWSPEQPFLYQAVINLCVVRVKTYFAMRKCSVEKDKKGILRFFLNNQPYFHNGLLDQGYWPDGLYTAPHDEALVYDIKSMKELGYNMIRKHSKVEPERWYYHCDRLGMLVWQDMVNGGTTYNMKFVCVLPNVWMRVGRMVKDNKYRAFSREHIEGRRQYYRELREMMIHLYHFPSIVAWVPFNEGWGQFDAAKASACVKKWDKSRLVDEASGWFDQGGGDMYSIHNYWRKLKVCPQKNRVAALTEYGGYSWSVQGHSFCETVYGYRTYNSSEALTKGYADMFERDIIQNIKNGLSAAVYTQVSDVEEEVNGILTYDRKKTKLEEKRVKELNKKLKEVFIEETD